MVYVIYEDQEPPSVCTVSLTKSSSSDDVSELGKDLYDDDDSSARVKITYLG